jgi:hypothetical protein
VAEKKCTGAASPALRLAIYTLVNAFDSPRERYTSVPLVAGHRLRTLRGAYWLPVTPSQPAGPIDDGSSQRVAMCRRCRIRTGPLSANMSLFIFNNLAGRVGSWRAYRLFFAMNISL